MKKQKIMKLFLILLPILAVGLATTGDSVMVFDPQTGSTDYYSYFTPLEVGSFQMITPLAAVLSLVSGILAAVYMVFKKNGLLKGIVGVSFCSATLAVLPILMPAEVKIMPNVGLPIFMMAQLFLAYILLKEPQVQEEKKAPRLDRR